MAFLYTAAHWLGFALLALLFLVFVAFGLYCLYIKYIHMKFDHIPGPPRDSFLLGHMPTMQREMDRDKVVHDTLLEWAEKYGPVYRVNFLHTVMLHVTCPEAVKECLMSLKYPKDPFTYKRLFNVFGKRFFGNGLVTDTDHDHWYKQRRIMDPAFSHSYLKGLMGIFNENAEGLMEKLEEGAESQAPVNIHNLVNAVTLDVIAKVAFGMDLNLLDDNTSAFPNAIALCLKGMINNIRKPFMHLLPWNWKFVKEVEDAAELLRSTGRECIENRKRAMRNKEDVPKDILTKILQCAVDEGGYDDEHMLDNFVTFFIAGQETTASQIAFTILELARHPEITEKLISEVDEAIGSKREIDFNDLAKLPYLSQVLKESLRIYPPAPLMTRLITKDTVIDGIRIPWGVTVFFNTYVMGRMERFFKDPLKFDPDRFHPDAPKPYFCYFPFALGPRSCLGQNFAQMEAKVVMAKLLQRFTFQLVPGQSFAILDSGALRPRDGVVCTIKARSKMNK
ncbi:cholesterol 24-hydroxylase-like [Amia ocellicauda]|uniref:cholesterol 24-hydroxylase-like n=1 Tax=Amia ocellicauda TaxID=2972642 RepID=UPI0034642910